jgi:poly-gamma-glutamate capsule biosynthesis protein CapA/YwtB (metallophosphatase superfamily)
MGRAMGQKLLREPGFNPFTTVAALLAGVDVRFANLEGPLSEQRGETMSRSNMLIFTGPPAGADALARAGFTVVSTANNHAWDYGEAALGETIANLDRVGVRHAGTGSTLEEAWRPAVIEAGGRRIAFIAATDVWNFGPLAEHPASAHVAEASPDAIARGVTAARALPGVDAVIASVHGGYEYVDTPSPRMVAIAHAAIDAGASAFFGHHPHVVQGVEWYRGKPVFYSLGNLLMQMVVGHEWTGWGFVARVVVEPGGAVSRAEACPYRILGLAPLPLAGDPAAGALQGVFFAHLRAVSASVGKVKIGAPADDGCAPIDPA